MGAAPARGTVADFVARQLAAWGVERVYGVAGDAVNPLVSLLAAGPKSRGRAAGPGAEPAPARPRWIVTVHESAAAMMAAAEAKLTGRPGVCAATSGPGLANLASGLGDAALDRVPVLALAGQVPRPRIGTGAKQYLDPGRLLGGLAVFVETAADPAAVPDVLAAAWRPALTRRGPAVVAVPHDLWLEPCDAPPNPPPPLPPPPEPDGASLEEAARLLGAARRPMLLLGGGARHAAAEALDLARTLGAGVVTTLGAKTAVDPDEPLLLGGLGEGGSEDAHALLQEADVVLMLGANWWPEGFVPARVRRVQVDVDPAAWGSAGPPALAVLGDAGAVARRLRERLRGANRDPDGEDWPHRIRQAHAAWRRRVRAEKEAPDPRAPARLLAAVEQGLRQAGANEAVIALDTGSHTLWFNRVFDPVPGQRLLYSGTWRTIGYALPAAVAAALCAPGRPVLALSGDGGFAQTALELATASRLGLRLAVVVLRDRRLALEAQKQERAGLTPAGVDAPELDPAAVARACGARGMQPGDGGGEDGDGAVAPPSEAVARALRSPGPAVVVLEASAQAVPALRA